MVSRQRVAITTAIGILSGIYCAGSLLIAAPAGITPELWFMIMILYARILQGFFIGVADGIPLPPLVRGAMIGTLFSILIAIVPLHALNYFGAAMLIVFGIFYGILADTIASWFVHRSTSREPDQMKER